MKTKQIRPFLETLNFTRKHFKYFLLRKPATTIPAVCLVQFIMLSYNVTAQSSSANASRSTLIVTLYGCNADGSKYIADGVMVNYAANFSNYVDDNDAEKIFGSPPSLAIDRNDTMLAVERRCTITKSDTIPLSLTGTSASNYMFEVSGSGFQPGIVAWIYDSYLDSSFVIDLQQATDIPFKITSDPASKSANRFGVIAVPTGVLPVTFTFLNAVPNGKNINITWGVDNENDIKQYIVQHSVDGVAFSDYTSLSPIGGSRPSGTYQVTFTGANAGDHFFRVESVDNDNKVSFSRIVSVYVTGNSVVSIYCNAVDNNNIRLVYNNLQIGNYTVEMVNAGGQMLYSQQQTLKETSGSLPLQLQTSLQHGLYYITIRSARGIQSTELVF
jgi:hypothetical protein